MFPEFFHILRPRKSSAHTNDGNRFVSPLSLLRDHFAGRLTGWHMINNESRRSRLSTLRNADHDLANIFAPFQATISVLNLLKSERTADSRSNDTLLDHTNHLSHVCLEYFALSGFQFAQINAVEGLIIIQDRKIEL